jgi:hypothetical protein
VVTNSGTPVARAEVFLVGPRLTLDIYSQTRQQALTTKTDTQGHFKFDPVTVEWKAVVVRCPEGFACVLGTEMPADGTITLSQWGRIEGASSPGMNIGGWTITLAPWTSGDEYSDLGVRFRKQVTASSEGAFRFSRVVPGEVIVTCVPPQPDGIVRPVINPSHTTYVGVGPGKTAQVVFTESPIHVKGHITRDGTVGTRIVGLISNSGALSDPPYPPNWATMMRRQHMEWRGGWGSTPEGKASFDALFARNVPIGRDGSFNIADVPAAPGRLRFSAENFEQGSMMSTTVASSDVRFDATRASQTANLIDVGDISLKPRRWLKLNDVAPDIVATNSDGSSFHLSELLGKGKLILLAVEGTDNGQPTVNSLGRIQISQFTGGEIADRFASSPTITLARVSPNKSAFAKHAVDPSPWQSVYVADAQMLPEEYATPSGFACLISSEGKVTQKFSLSDRQIYFALDAQQDPGCNGIGDVKVIADHNDADKATSDFKFANVPSISTNDAGKKAVFTIVDGQPADYGAPLSCLNDGRGPKAYDDESGMFTFANGTLEGRIGIDLTREISVGQINTYTWYRHGNRWPQVYRVYGSDGKSPNFNSAPKIGVDPAKCGWTPIAWVDTRPMAGGIGLHDGMVGQDGVSVRGRDKAVGSYRYLLFDIFATEPHDPWCQAFWSEINITEN